MKKRQKHLGKQLRFFARKEISLPELLLQGTQESPARFLKTQLSRVSSQWARKPVWLASFRLPAWLISSVSKKPGRGSLFRLRIIPFRTMASSLSKMMERNFRKKKKEKLKNIFWKACLQKKKIVLPAEKRFFRKGKKSIKIFF